MVKEIIQEESLLTLKQIVKYLQLSSSSVYSLVQNNKIPAYKVGKQWRFKKSEIDEWLLLNK